MHQFIDRYEVVVQVNRRYCSEIVRNIFGSCNRPAANNELQMFLRKKKAANAAFITRLVDLDEIFNAFQWRDFYCCACRLGSDVHRFTRFERIGDALLSFSGRLLD